MNWGEVTGELGGRSLVNWGGSLVTTLRHLIHELGPILWKLNLHDGL